MTESVASDAGAPATPPAEAGTALPAALEALRVAGAERLDPVHFAYMEVLARRMQGAPEAIRPVLRGKLHRAIAECTARLQQAHTAPSPDQPAGSGDRIVTATQQPAGSPLGDLNDYIRSAVPDATEPGSDVARPETAGAPRELQNAERFRLAWSRFHAEDELERAIGRGPEDAGPLNSHGLLLRTLALMRELSPDYLQRFLGQADAWLWLGQARGKLAPRK